MPLLNFQKQFASDVKAGIKRQTIRAKRKYPIKRGDTLYLYTGLRTKYARKLREAECKSVEDIFMSHLGIEIENGESISFLTDLELENIAHADGFKSWPHMLDWFDKTHGLPFEGDLIKW